MGCPLFPPSGKQTRQRKNVKEKSHPWYPCVNDVCGTNYCTTMCNSLWHDDSGYRINEVLGGNWRDRSEEAWNFLHVFTVSAISGGLLQWQIHFPRICTCCKPQLPTSYFTTKTAWAAHRQASKTAPREECAKYPQRRPVANRPQCNLAWTVHSSRSKRKDDMATLSKYPGLI